MRQNHNLCFCVHSIDSVLGHKVGSDREETREHSKELYVFVQRETYFPWTFGFPIQNFLLPVINMY